MRTSDIASTKERRRKRKRKKEGGEDKTRSMLMPLEFLHYATGRLLLSPIKFEKWWLWWRWMSLLRHPIMRVLFYVLEYFNASDLFRNVWTSLVSSLMTNGARSTTMYTPFTNSVKSLDRRLTYAFLIRRARDKPARDNSSCTPLQTRCANCKPIDIATQA